MGYWVFGIIAGVILILIGTVSQLLDEPPIPADQAERDRQDLIEEEEEE